MSAALVKKELRDQRPFLALGLVLSAFDLLEVVLGQPDMSSLGENFHGLTDFSSRLLLVLAFAVGTGLLVREQDEGTLRFLDGLPVTRLRLFATKLAVALGVLLVYPVVRTALAGALHLWSRGSLDAPVHPHLLAVALGLNALMVLVGLSLGMLLGHLRSLAWACAATLAVLVVKAGELVPRAKALDPFELLELRIVGLRWEAPVEALALQGALAAAMLAVVAAAYAGARGRRLVRLAQATKRPFWSAVVLVLTVVTCFWAVAVVGTGDSKKKKDPAAEAQEEGEPNVPGAEFARPETAFISTRHYTFAYPAFRASSVRPLAEKADAAFEKVLEVLPAGGEAPVDVDMSGSMANTAGTAFWDRVRMQPRDDDAEEVLVHETAHVLASRMVREAGAAILSRMPVLNEGLAQWVAYRAPGGEARRERDAFEAAVVFARHEVRLDELADYEKFEAKRDQGLKYPLGAMLIQSLADRYGDQAPRRLLETLARPDFPAEPRGLLLWQALFQLSGFDLTVVADGFFQRLEAKARERAEEIAALPRLRAALEAGRTRVRIKVLADKPLPEKGSIVVRTRPTEDAALRDYRAFDAEKDGTLDVDRDEVALDTLCFQPGLRHGTTVFFEPWQCLAVRWARDDSALEKEGSAPP